MSIRRTLARGRWALSAVLLLLLIVYGVYDWTRPCVQGPIHGVVMALLNGGSYTVRCAG